jgi:tetratricopeptide (TPR) repeat protein
MRHPARVYVVDTNALLNDPDVIYAFSGAEVVIPAVVLKELDELKRKRTDARVRYHGRKATRLLFEISKNGRLLDGIILDNGSLLRVDAGAEMENLPDELDPGRPDDQIIGLAYSLNQEPGVHATLVTNDLNMLLRGEALGLAAYRFEGKLEHLHEHKATPMEWLRQRRLPVALALVACFFFATTVYLYATRDPAAVLADLPALDETVALRSLGMDDAAIEQHYRERIQDDRNDFEALAGLGHLLYGQGDQLGHLGDVPGGRAKYLEAGALYQRALAIRPEDADIRTDLGITLLKIDHHLEAVEAFKQAIADAPENPWAHYNLGVAYATAKDYQNARGQLLEFLQLAQGREAQLPVFEAQQLLAEIDAAEKAE